MRGWDVNRLRDADVKALERIVSDIPDFATLAVICRGAQEPDGRLKAVKLLRKYGRDVNFTEQDAGALVNWIRRRFRALGKDADPAAAEALIYASGSLMNSLVPEIEKIAAGTASERVTAADVEALAFRIPETRAFDMTDAISARDFDTAARLLGDLFDMGEEPAEGPRRGGLNMRRPLRRAPRRRVPGRGRVHKARHRREIRLRAQEAQGQRLALFLARAQAALWSSARRRIRHKELLRRGYGAPGRAPSPLRGGMRMIKVREVIVCEGRYDKDTLSQVFDAVIIETGGFGVFNDREKPRPPAPPGRGARAHYPHGQRRARASRYAATSRAR